MTTLEKAARAPSEEALAALIRPLWLAAKPSQTAQRIRSELGVAFDNPQLSQWAADYIPEYVWDLLDIAAQRGINSISSALLDPSDEVVAEIAIPLLMAANDEASEGWARAYWLHAKGEPHKHGVPITCDACVYDEFNEKARAALRAAVVKITGHD